MGPEPTLLAVGEDEDCLDVFLSIISLFSLPLSVGWLVVLDLTPL